MARRATYFFDVHKVDSPRILISGGWEFMRPEGPVPSSDILKGLTKAYGLMKYDIGLLSEEESLAMQQAGVQPDLNRKTAAEEPFTVVETKAGDRIGFLRFPSLKQGNDIPSPELIKKISTSIKEKRKKVNLLVAMSDWGWVAEREFFAQTPEAVPDFLFGSGQGSGVNGRIQADGRCVWIRPHDKGRTVSEVQVYAWPDRSKPFIWKEPDNLMCISTGLGDNIEDDEEVSAILH